MATIERFIASKGYDRVSCWVNPVALPVGKEVLLLSQKLLIEATDCFSELSLFRSPDGGKNWCAPESIHCLAGTAGGDGLRERYLASAMHRCADGRVLVLVTSFYYDGMNRIVRSRPQRVKYLYFDPARGSWDPPRELELPAPADADVLAVDAQFVQLDGDLLLPYCVRQSSRFYSRIAKIREESDGRLTVADLSEPVVREEGRGFLEPSLCRFEGKYYLSLRSDDSAYCTFSDDWKVFPEASKWCFADGSWLGSYNTMTRLLCIGGKLYLVYTRKGLNNGHVFRHRAPLLIGEVVPDKPAVLPETEQIVVPEHGARLGNFTAAGEDENHAYVSVAEWMQTVPPDTHDCRRCERYGADNRVWYVKVNS